VPWNGTSLTDPDARVPRSAAMGLLERLIDLTGKATIGLEAAERIEALDFGVLEKAAVTAPTLAEAIRLVIRYFELLDEGADMSLDTHRGQAVWRFGLKRGLAQPPAADDFAVAAALAFARRNMARYEPPTEIRLAHPEPPYAEAYRRILGAPARFGMAFNAVVFPREVLAAPMRLPDTGASRDLTRTAREGVKALHGEDSLAERIRRDLLGRLGHGQVGMAVAAKRQAMAVATLRRRLEGEGITYAEILEGVREEEALEYLQNATLSVTEIAFLLGYRNATSFSRAFHRWTGMTPSERRSLEAAQKGTTTAPSDRANRSP